MNVRLSKSALENFNRCARCFWLEKVQEIKQPQGIRAGVPMGIDRCLKGHYDAHRATKTVPPELVGCVPGGLYPEDRLSMKDLRNWRKGLTVAVEGFELSTALDDLLFDPATGRYNMIDYKSKARLTDEEETRKYYQTQADASDLALNANGYPTDGATYFVYYSPVSVDASAPSPAVPFRWNAQVIRITADHARVKDLLARAGRCLEAPNAPAGSPACEQCNYLVQRRSYDLREAPAEAF